MVRLRDLRGGMVEGIKVMVLNSIRLRTSLSILDGSLDGMSLFLFCIYRETIASAYEAE